MCVALKIAEMTPGPINVFYATVSGNAEQLAEETVRKLEAAGPGAVTMRNLAEVSATDLRAVQVGLFIISTWGDGEPPPDAQAFFADLESSPAGRLEHLGYAVLALGSSRYPDFCGCGRRLDERLAGLGARRLMARVDCDVKYKASFTAWINRVAKELAGR